MSDGMRDKVEGKLKETEGELTNDKARENAGRGPAEVGRGEGQGRGPP